MNIPIAQAIKPYISHRMYVAVPDTLIEVRTNFALKVRRAVQIFQSNAATTQRATKYAAMLPMAGADPWAEGRHAAFAMLQVRICKMILLLVNLQILIGTQVLNWIVFQLPFTSSCATLTVILV